MSAESAADSPGGSHDVGLTGRPSWAGCAGGIPGQGSSLLADRADGCDRAESVTYAPGRPMGLPLPHVTDTVIWAISVT